MFSKVATENILSEQPKFKKIKPTPLPWMSTPPTAVSPYLVFPIAGGRGSSTEEGNKMICLHIFWKLF